MCQRARLRGGRTLATGLSWPTARHFEELVCWQLADQLKTRIYIVAARPQLRADRRLHDQIREAAASATSNMPKVSGATRTPNSSTSSTSHAPR
jgi:hypothetical protein